MKDVWKKIKRVLRVLVMGVYWLGGMFFHYMERAANWLIGFGSRTQYVKRGACIKCGKCCRLLAIQFPKFFHRFPRLIRFFSRWHEFRYGFTYYNVEGNYLLYRCNFLSPEGRCRIYFFRPRLCREYPKLGLYGKPPTHALCGFYFVKRAGGRSFEEDLHEAAQKK